MNPIKNISHTSSVILGGLTILTILGTACKSSGNVSDNQFEISGTIIDQGNGDALKDAIITNNRTEKSVLSDAHGRFSTICEKGDSLKISYVGFATQSIPVNPSDSTDWIISMQELSPIIEPAPQMSYSTNDKLKMAVLSPETLMSPVDSIVVEMVNTSDKEATFGEWFRLEYQKGSQWVKVPYNDIIQRQIDGGVEMIFNDVGYIIPPHESQTYANPTRVYNEKITPGRYRLSKKFSYPPYPTEKSDTAYVEFEIYLK